MADGLTIKAFASEPEADVLALIRAYLDGWRYSRPADAELLAHWRTLGAMFQPEHILLGYRDGAAQVILHGERNDTQHNIHLLAMTPESVDDAMALLRHVEERARAEGVQRLCGPHYRSGRFYGGYVCGLEPYLPHWCADGTEAFVGAGFRITLQGVLMGMQLRNPISATAPPAGYEIRETPAVPEFEARPFRFAAFFGGQEVAASAARFYPKLLSPDGGPVGQVGHVGTVEAHRGKGLATALVQRCAQRLKEWGATEALIATGLENFPALRSYDKVGFERRYNINEWSKDLK